MVKKQSWGEMDKSEIPFQDVLQALDAGQIALETTGPSSPGVFRPIGGDNYTQVIMPMFVQW